MRLMMILLALLVALSANLPAQTRAQNQEKLIQFLTTDLQLSADQVTQVRGFVKQADNDVAQREIQVQSNPIQAPSVRKQVIMELGKRIEGILTPSQLEQYPKTKKKLYDFLQARYEQGIDKQQQEGAKSNEMQPVEVH